MKIIYGLTTYNRKDYLQNHIDTWYKTINKSYDWTIYINDDGSDDGSIEYIESLNLDGVKLVKNIAKRRGVHYAINKILKYASENTFDIGFKAEDDIFFKKSGWDDLYLKSIKKSGYQHFAFIDTQWAKKYTGAILLKKKITNKEKLIEAKISNAYCAYGCFWTFTPDIIKKIGYIDVNNFGLAGNGHSDYTLRCCDAGFNSRKPFYDVVDSENYISMIKDNYRGAGDKKERNFASTFNVRHGHKGKVLEIRNRGYIPYRELPYDVFGEEI